MSHSNPFRFIGPLNFGVSSGMRAVSLEEMGRHLFPAFPPWSPVFSLSYLLYKLTPVSLEIIIKSHDFQKWKSCFFAQIVEIIKLLVDTSCHTSTLLLEVLTMSSPA